MDSQSWEEVCQYFDRCLDLSDEECISLLDAERPAPEVRQEVLRLRSVQRDALASGFLSHPVSLDELSAFDTERRNRFSSGDKLANRFEIVRLLGFGGMGEVYEAIDGETDEPVAIKVLSSAMALQGQAVVRFRREFRLSRRITSSYVCRVNDIGRHASPTGEVVFLSMELLQGKTLAKRLDKNAKLTTAEARPIVEQIASGLAAAHRCDVIHRDLKPSNIMLCADRAVIMDFGLARQHQSLAEPSLTSTGKVLGTLNYVAPEQLNGSAITAKTDIYSLGLLMYEMVTGHRPFEAEDSVAAAMKRLAEEPPPPRNYVRDLDPRWQAAILACLERDPALRPDSAEAVVKLLETPPRFRLRPQTRRRLLQTAAGAAGISAVVALREGISRYSSWKPKNAPGAKILVTEIENKINDPKLAGITSLFRLQLGQSPEFNVVDEGVLTAQYQQMTRKPEGPDAEAVKREAAWRAGIPVVVFATLNSVGTDYAFTIRMEFRGSSPTNQALKRSRTENAQSRDDVMQAVSKGAKWVRTGAGENLESISKTDMLPEDVTTPSWEAFSYYARGEQLSAAHRFEDALLTMESALQRDPQFTLAALRRADLLMNRFRQREGLIQWRSAIQMLNTRKVTRREELNARGMYSFDTGDPESADRYFAAWALEFPNDTRGVLLRTLPLILSGHAEQAAAMLEAVLRTNPSEQLPYLQLINCNLVLGRVGEARLKIAHYRKLGDPERADLKEAGAYYRELNFRAALQLYRKLQGSRNRERATIAALHEAFLWIEAENYSQAIAVTEKFLKTGGSVENDPEHAMLFCTLGWAYLRAHEIALAVKAALEALRFQSGYVILVNSGTIVARSGAIAEANRILEKCAEFQDLRAYQVTSLRIRGEISMHQGHRSESLTYFRKASELEPKLANREYLIEALEPSDAQCLNLCRLVLSSPWTFVRDPTVDAPGVMATATRKVLTVNPTDATAQAVRKSLREMSA